MNRTRLIITSLLIILCINAISQNSNILTELNGIKDVPYLPKSHGNCPDSIYWNLVKEGLGVIPDLIDCIISTDSTQIPIPNWGGYYTIGDIAFAIICDIIHGLPLQDFYSKGIISKENETYLTYHSFVCSSEGNRQILRHQLKKWFRKHRSELIWVKDDSEWKPPKNCKYIINRNPAGGYYMKNTYE